MAIDIGLIAYEAYRVGVDYVSFDGEFLPKWAELGKIRQDAWRHAACAVLQYIDDEKKQYEKDKAEDKEVFDY